MRIEDGTGKGNVAKVDDENRLRTYSVVENEMSHVSENDGLAFSWTIVGYNYTAGDTILLVRNDSDKDLHIQKVMYGSDAATKVQIHRPANATLAGTAVVGVNANSKSGNVAEATAYANETGTVQGDILCEDYVAAGQQKEKDMGGAVILGKNDCIAIDLVTVGTDCMATITGFYHD